MNVQDAAQQLEVKPSTIYRLCREGLLGHMRIGIGRGAVRIDQADVDKFREAARAKAVAMSRRKEPDPRIRSAAAVRSSRTW